MTMTAPPETAAGKSLLPPNATDYEHALEQVSLRLENLAVDIASFWNPDTMPEHLIPWLGWEWSLDTWSPEWSGDIKRGMLKGAMPYHRIKGTRKSVNNAVQALGSNISITEWFEATPAQDPFTFEAQVDSVIGNASGVLQQQLIEAIDRAKPVRCHYTVSVRTHASASLTTLAHASVASYKRLTLCDTP